MKQKKSFLSEELFRPFIAMMIVTVALAVASVALIQHDAGAKTSRYRRDAQRFAVQAMRLRSTGEMRVGYDVNVAYQHWLELELLALSADKAGDAAAAKRYEAVQEQIAKASPLLRKPLFDGAKDSEPNVAAYEAQVYVEQATALSERATQWYAVGEAWDGKGDANITHLSLLAVALALFGLAATIDGKVRWVFVFSAMLMFVLTLVWVADVFVRPVPATSEPAIDAYARGVGLAYRGENDQAIAAFDEALAQKNDYASAYYERGNAHFERNSLTQAVKDYEDAKKNVRDDSSVNRALGWTNYLLGNLDEAIKADRRAVALNANLIGVRLDLALAYLAANRGEDARKEYTDAMDSAAKQLAEARAAGKEAPYSLWFSLDEGAGDLQNLLDRVNNRAREWTVAPPRESVTNPAVVNQVGQDIIVRLKNFGVALEYVGKPVSGTTSARLSAPKFAIPSSDPRAAPAFTEKFPSRTKEVRAYFDFSGMQNDKPVVIKVYVNGAEDSTLRIVEKWTLGATGKAEYAIGAGYSDVYTLASGDYDVEIYVDSQLVQSGKFAVQ